MESRRFRELILKILDGRINEKEYKELSNYTVGIIKNVSSRLAQKHGGPVNKSIIDLLMTNFNYREYKEAYKHIFEEFIIKILSKKKILYQKDLSDEKFKRYIVSMIYNLIIDLKRDITKTIKAQKDIKEKIIDSATKEIYELARIELKHSIRGSVQEDDIKYLCYLLSSQKYKCLWTGKKESAIYQDVRRNKERVLKVLSEIIHDLNLDEKVYEDVIKPVLSEICEELRNKKCKGGDK